MRKLGQAQKLLIEKVLYVDLFKYIKVNFACVRFCYLRL